MEYSVTESSGYVTESCGCRNKAFGCVNKVFVWQSQKLVLSLLYIINILRNNYNLIMMTKIELEEKIIKMLKTVYDPEIPVDIYELGLIYKIDVTDDFYVNIDMTLTAPNCPAADFIVEDVRQKVESIEGLKGASVNLVFEPEWDKDMMSEEAKLELGFL